jgi:hypothetical protein
MKNVKRNGRGLPEEFSCRTDESCFNSRQEKEMFLFCKRSIQPLGLNQPSIEWVPGAICPEIRRPATEADQSLLLSAEVKNVWRYNSIPPHAFKACKEEL